jgi:hypothetical protein
MRTTIPAWHSQRIQRNTQNISATNHPATTFSFTTAFHGTFTTSGLSMTMFQLHSATLCQKRIRTALASTQTAQTTRVFVVAFSMVSGIHDKRRRTLNHKMHFFVISVIMFFLFC